MYLCLSSHLPPRLDHQLTFWIPTGKVRPAALGAPGPSRRSRIGEVNGPALDHQPGVISHSCKCDLAATRMDAGLAVVGRDAASLGTYS
jgi:hypothetical protein